MSDSRDNTDKDPLPPSAEPDDTADAPARSAPDMPEPGGEDATPTAWHSGDDSLRDLMAGNFIEYASYVIKDRAIPDLSDGLKPVQRRILHALHELDDGRYHKVANIVGHTMRYHPHGDASIYSALVVVANKEFFIDRQGNFGNIYTGDEASAARYIECRLSNLAREVMFNPELTEYVDSYDGRNREPVALPAKVPALLMLGSDGIAVGMTTRIFPHNFTELLKAQIAILRGEPFQVYPDFQTAGIMDAAAYNEGTGRIKVRARIEVVNDKTLAIREIPPTTTTEGLISSIEDAVRRGKLKLASINDYTAEKVEIEISLPRGVYAEETVKLLYGYTDCEVSLTSNITVIRDNRPVQMRVGEVLRYNTDKLLEDLRRELELELRKLQERFHEKTLAQIFIENRIYKRIEKCETYDQVLAEVRTGLDKFRDQLRRDITDSDLEKLLQIQIRRISLFDINKNRQELDDILRTMEEVQENLKHLKRYAIRYLDGLVKKYGHLYPRRTQIADLADVNVREVALRNIKIGHDRSGQFVGSQVRNSNKNEEPIVCSEFDRLVLLRNDGTFKVTPISEKQYVGPLKVVLLADREQIYSMIYRDRKTGTYYAKRFRIESYIMDKEYTTLPPNCIIETLYTNYGIIARCEFAAKKHLRTKFVDVNFDDVPLRSAAARGFKIAEHEVEHVIQIKRGSSSPQGGEDMPPPDGTPVTETQPAETGAPAIGQAAPNQEPTPRAVSEPPASAAVEPPVKSSVSVILTAENTAGKPTKQTSPETRPEPGTPKRGSAKRQPPELVESERGGASAERATPRPMEVAARQPTAIDRTPKASAASPPLPVGKPPAKRKGSTLERVAPAPPPVGKEEGKLTETKSKPLSAPKDSPTKPTQAPATLRSQSVPPPRVQPKLGKPQGPVATVPVAKAKIKPSGKAGTDVKAKPDGGKPLRKLVDEDSPFFLE